MNQLKVKLTIFILCVAGFAFGQQDPLFTQYMFNPSTINPAITGGAELRNISSTFRKQWTGIYGAPSTMSISYDGNYNENKVGLGGSLIYDVIGPVKQTGIYLNYGYHIQMEGEDKLSFGLMAGFNHYQFNLLGLSMHEADDDVNMDAYNSKFLPNFGVGMIYNTEDYYFGFSIPKLLRNSLEDSNNTLTTEDREERHYFLLAGYAYDLNENTRLKPTAIARWVNGSPVSLDLTGNIILYKELQLGITYRFSKTIGGIIGWQLSDKLFLAYSYDFNSRLRGFNSGSHEVFISYNFLKKGQELLSPRFF